jgi:hypothetical protein
MARTMGRIQAPDHNNGHSTLRDVSTAVRYRSGTTQWPGPAAAVYCLRLIAHIDAAIPAGVRVLLPQVFQDGGQRHVRLESLG